MASTNYTRMMDLIDEVFETRSDPEQLQVTGAQLQKLESIHPATLSEYADENGPLIWVLMIPTTLKIMSEFLSDRITEKQLLDLTLPGGAYECIYLCSATTLPEARKLGKTRELCLDAIGTIRRDHHIKALFSWAFTKEGERLAGSVAARCRLPLLNK